MSRKPLSLLGSAALLLAGLTALTGCGVSPAYTPVRTAVAAEPVAVETAPAPAQPVENVGYDDTDPAALTDFHETLAPYGSWEEDATYGTVWVPASERVGADFAPYKTAGHWELDQNEEWLWVSDYDDSFGWVVFHYGRWAHTEARGWVWIPGRRYAPAWVAWQTGDPGYGYIGWAAMPPAYYWHSGAVVWLDVYPTPYYVYCPTSYVFYRDWHTHAVPRQHVVAVATPMRPYGTPRGEGRVYAQPHRGPSARSGVVPPGSYPTSRHAMAEGHRRYAIPSSPATAGGGNGLGGSPRAGSRSRPQSFEAPGGPERGPGRAIGGSDGPSGRPSFAGGPEGGPTRSPSAFAAGPPGARSAPPVAAPPGRSPSAFDSRGPSSSPPMARVPSEGPTRMPPSSGPAPAGAPVARPSSPSFSGPVQAPSRPSAFSSPTRSAPSPSPVSAPSRAPSSFSGPSRSPSPSSFSAPSRASSPSFSAPSRASSPAVSSPSRSSSSSGSRPSAPSGGSRGRRLSPVTPP